MLRDNRAWSRASPRWCCTRAARARRAEVSGSDEIADLGRRFNLMAQQLEQSYTRSLRERRDGILPLAGHFLDQAAPSEHPMASLTTSKYGAGRPWPGII
ncbi:MAG: HAMP domain-containing protein [Gammaproteobacteria bacterium]